MSAADEHAAYDPSTAPHPAVTVDAILFTVDASRLKVLLIRRQLAPFAGRWALPGGFVRMDESLDDAGLLGELAPKAGSDATSVGWYPVDELPPLAFDHRRIVDYALERLRYKAEYAPVAFQLLPREFTLSELQEVYEVILGKPLDKRNFRRKVLSLDIVEETGKERREGRGRPAALYRFSKKGFRNLGGGVVLAF